MGHYITLLYRILRAWFYAFTGLQKELASKRMEICSQCSLRSGLFCSECGCPLFAKTNDINEGCPLKRW